MLNFKVTHESEAQSPYRVSHWLVLQRSCELINTVTF